MERSHLVAPENVAAWPLMPRLGKKEQKRIRESPRARDFPAAIGEPLALPSWAHVVRDTLNDH